MINARSATIGLPIALFTLTSMSLTAQIPVDQRPDGLPPKHMRLVPAEEMLGYPIAFEPTIEAKVDATVSGEDRADRPTGTMIDGLVDVSTGELDWVILDFDEGFLGLGEEHITAIPFHRMRCIEKDGERRVLLNLTKEQIARLPEYDLEAARDRGVDSVVRALEYSWAEIVPLEGDDAEEGVSDERRADEASAEKSKADAKMQEQKQKQKQKESEGSWDEASADADRPESLVIAGTEYLIFPERFALLSQVRNHDIRASDGEFGHLETVLLDPVTGGMAFGIVERGGFAELGESRKLVPFDSIQLLVKRDASMEGPSPCIRVDMPAADLKALPEYARPENGWVSKAQSKKARKAFVQQSRDNAMHKKKHGEKKHGKKKHGDGSASGASSEEADASENDDADDGS